MNTLILVTDSYFDGARRHERGPYTVELVNGRIEQILPADRADALAVRHRQVHGTEALIHRVPFIMPGLVEAHCHLFLDGGELDFQKRKEHLAATFDRMLASGRRNLAQNAVTGITFVRDAGDLHGVNTRLETEARSAPHSRWPEILSAGRALRKAGRYGGFMAVEVTDADSIVRTIHELAPHAGQLKVLLTGIIDFEHGRMKGGAQFDLEETKLIVRTARELGKRTFAHCSGIEGLRLAVEAGLDSIEHGFFMERDILRAMADKGIAWVPTFAPVHFQYARPELAGWSRETVAGLRRILERHFESVALAGELSVPVVAGSDAGSYGVPHGRGLIDELGLLCRAGLPVESVLASATSLPRRLWSCEPADLRPGSRANLAAFAGSPFVNIDHLRRPLAVLRGDDWFPLRQTDPVLTSAV